MPTLLFASSYSAKIQSLPTIRGIAKNIRHDADHTNVLPALGDWPIDIPQ
ncbi:MAG: hypothetical protein ACD_42C00431G0001 [uncultured bacterium]|nr:MAG: hypothetical protein ACD_42C00431G0001 [uncultured bacterium]